MRHDTESSQYLRSNSLGYFSLLSHSWWKYYSLFLSIKYNIFHSCHDQAVISSFGCRIVKWSTFTILRRKYFHQICRMNEKSFKWVPCLCISQHDNWWSAMGELWKLASTLNIMTTTSNVWYVCHISEYNFNQSINQSNPVLLKERVRIPRTRHAGGAAMLWGKLLLDGVGSCRLFFTDDLHDNLSWVPASDKPHTFKSCFTHSSQVFFGRPGPFLPGTASGLDLTLFISPLERMTCPNHLSRRSRTRMARSHIPSLACSSSIDGSSDGLTPQIQRIIARSLRHSRWRAAESWAKFPYHVTLNYVHWS